LWCWDSRAPGKKRMTVCKSEGKELGLWVRRD
jgi:hypothetical protein